MQPVMAVLAGGDVSVAGRDVSIAGGEGNVWPVITAQYGQLARNHQMDEQVNTSFFILY